MYLIPTEPSNCQVSVQYISAQLLARLSQAFSADNHTDNLALANELELRVNSIAMGRQVSKHIPVPEKDIQ